MRIAYVSLHWPRTRQYGVGQKISEQLRIWRSAGHTAELFMHTSEYQPASDLIQGTLLTYRPSKDPFGFIPGEIDRISAAKRLKNTIRNFNPDVIYLRYGIYVYPIHQLSELSPVIEEINTDDVSQHRGLGNILYLYNRFSRGILLRKVSGLVCVSQELAELGNLVRFKKPTRVITNGIDMRSIVPLPAPSNSRPRLVFLASPGYYWHGVDKLIPLASEFPDLDIDLIGYEKNDEIKSLPKNLSFRGYLSQTAYSELLAQADLSMGTLALHRKKMNEASPLKTRECLAYGLPIVLPYKDTDLNDLECDFLLKIPNREDNIETHGEAIRDFAYRMRGKRADRSVLLPRIDLKRKEEHRLTFFNQVVTGFNDL